MRPQGYGHAAPFGQNSGMMSFSFCYRADSIRKPEGLGEIVKPKNSLQSLNPVALHKRPAGDLRLKLIYLEFVHARRVSPTRSTLFFAQYARNTHR